MAILDDSVDLVIWYEKQVDCGTYKTDAEIACSLGWWTGGQKPDTLRKKGRGRILLNGADVARVRRARRFVDRNNERQPFVGYSFGTKRNGLGPRFSMLITPQQSNAPEAVNESASEQIGRAVQAAQQHSAEVARMVDKLSELENKFFEFGELDRALCIHDARNDLNTFGTITMPTLQRARELGIVGLLGDS